MSKSREEFTQMIETKFNAHWQFWVEKNAFALVWKVPEEAQVVTLPHDAMAQEVAKADSKNKGNTGYRDGGVYNYVKSFLAPKEYQEKTIQLKFEGVYMNAFVYINGQLAGKCPYGYSTFYVTLNPFLKYDAENEIRVIVRNGAMTNSRWYSGSGIYRDVYLLVSDLTYMTPDTIQIKTEAVDEDYAVLSVETQIRTRRHVTTELRLETTLMDLASNKLLTESVPVSLFEQDKRIMSQRMILPNPKPWSAESPTLYGCRSRLLENDKVIDESYTTFGIRTLQLDAKRGLRVNGQSVKLRGACIHHDSGLLGAATYEDAQYRQIEILKNSGFNAVRMSHHPMAPAMLRACDALGVYVMDEAFDMWIRNKSDYDYGMFFQEWWEKDIEAMVQKDWNHPCVLMYSIGNEIPEIATPQGIEICQKIVAKIRNLDPTRYTLASINGVFAASDSLGEVMADVMSEVSAEGSKSAASEGNVNNFLTLMDRHLDKIVVHSAITTRLEKACATTDIAGYNYMTARYEADGKKYPNRIIVGSETYPPEIARNWALVEQLNHVIGDFTWTGWDYIGEAGVGVPAYNWGEGGFGATFPCQLAYCGDIDITGVRRPASYYREIVFGIRKAPYIAVQNPNHYGKHLIKTPWVISDAISSWTWNGFEGKSVVIELYAPGTEVELICNGRSLGRKAAGQAVGFKVLFETTYQAGTLEAIAYDQGLELGRMTLATAGAKRKILIQPELQNNKELIYVPISIVDENGQLVTDADVLMEISVEGGATLVGFGSGNPKPLHPYFGNVTDTFYGQAMAILKKTLTEEDVAVKIQAEGYEETEIWL